MKTVALSSLRKRNKASAVPLAFPVAINLKVVLREHFELDGFLGAQALLEAQTQMESQALLEVVIISDHDSFVLTEVQGTTCSCRVKVCGTDREIYFTAATVTSGASRWLK